MTPEEWQRAKEVFQGALEREPHLRAAFVAEACSGHSELQREIERLISLHEQASDFIETPAIDSTIFLVDQEPEESVIGKRMGPYKVVREVGHGGMGAVYLAVRADDQYQKHVAIKLVKRGMDSTAILRRFRNERQILASLDHPNIAKLLDGGTTDDGLPYFVMDYIEGLPIDTYCDTNKLSTAERLKLFRTVCSAVQYAHRNLIVHRDIKPSNILITADGTPKLLDFGIAKLTNPDLTSLTVDQTVTGFLAMTPAYASPEQVRGLAITTASDVYSLGVVLYELLTGHAPYRFKSRDPQEIAHVVCEQEPQKPSTAVRQIETLPRADGQTQMMLTPEIVSKTREGQPEKLRRKLSGDLDNVVLMAIRKEPLRRYSSVEQFSEDIRRHLEGLPVIATKDTFGYRSSKFIRRHKVGVIAAVLVIASLVTGLSIALWQAKVARAERATAERRFNDVRKLAHSLMFDLNEKIEQEPTEARSLLVNIALEYLDRLAQEASADASLQRELATAYDKVGDILGNPYNPNLGDTAGAISSYRKALAIRKSLLANTTDADARRDLARSYSQLASIMWTVSDTTEVIENERKAIEIYEELLRAGSEVKDRRDLAICSGMLAEAQTWAGDTASAAESIRKTRSIFETLAAADPGNPQAARDLSTAYDKEGEILDAAGDTAAAQEAYNRELAISEQQAQTDSSVPVRRNLAFSYNRVGDLLYEISGQTNSHDDYQKSLAYYRKAFTISEEIAKADQKNVRAQRDLSVSYNKLGDALCAMGDKQIGVESYRKSLAIRKTLAAIQSNATTQSDLAVCYGRIGDALTDLGSATEAIESLRKATAIYESISNGDPANAVARRDVVTSAASLAGAHMVAASQPSAGKAKRVEHLLEARAWNRRAFDILVDLQKQGTTRPADADQLQKISAEIARCDSALAKLQH